MLRIAAVWRVRLLSCVWPVLFALPLAAQQGTAELRGRVVDDQSAAVPGAAVTVRNEQTGLYRQTTSARDGSYFLAGITPGSYEVGVELSGFKRSVRRGVLLEVGKTTSYDVRLQLGAVEEQVDVLAEAPLVDLTSKEVGGHIAARELVDLPSVNRNYIGFVGLLPGIIPNISTESFGSDSVNANGQDARNNNYLLDGGNNNDDVIGQRAGTQARTPLEAIQEFQVLTSQFDAEFGRTTGAVINAVTKQGTNELHGSAFGYLQDAGFTSRDYFVRSNPALRKPDTRFVQYGFTVGGPLVRNRAHFFASLERVQNDRGNTIVIPARPELNTTATTADRVWNTLVRLDHQISAAHTWSVRWLRESSPQSNQIIPLNNRPVSLTAAREESDVDQTVAAALESTFGSTRHNSLRVAFTREDVAFANPAFNANGGDQAALPPTLQFLTFVDQQNNVAQARVNNAWQIEDTFSWYLTGGKGSHEVRLGVQYQYVSVDFSDQGNLNGTFSFRGDQPFNPADPRSYPERLQIRVPGAETYLQKEHFWSVFAQDKWKLDERLTLSLGLRYDRERIPLPELDNPRFASSDAYPVDGNNFAPRVGLAYRLTGDGRSVARAGYGRFFDKTHFELISALRTSGVFSSSFLVNFPANNADPGPSQGQLPGDPFLRGVTVDRARLAALFPPGSRLRNTGTVFLDNPERRVPYTDQFSLGVEREVLKDLSLSLDYVHGEGRDQLMTRDLNPGLRVDTSRTGRIVREDPNFVTSVLTRVNEGRTRYDALQVQLEKRYAHSYRFRLSYTLSNSRGNTSANGVPQSNFQLLHDTRLGLNQGPTDFDRRHNFVFSGAALVPGTGGLNISTVVRALSGLAFTLQDTSSDPDRNGLLFDPLPAGRYSGSGAKVLSVDNDGGRNGARGPGFFQVDLRLGYHVRLGTRRLELFGEVFNLTNRANFDNPSGDRRASTFLVLTALRPGAIPRTGQLGARFVF